jgi:Glycosyltransferase family 87
VNVRARTLIAIGWPALLIVALLGGVTLSVLGLAHVPAGGVLFDFRGGLYDAGQAISHGHSPYQPAFLAHQAAIMRAGGIAQGETVKHLFSIPVYPAPANVAVVPLSLLPFWLAGTLFTLLSLAAMIFGLRLLGVSDWRCTALALLCWPFIYGLYLGALGPFLLLGAGVAWRWRARLWAPAIAIASLVVTKIFPWPLAVWLLITRRFAAAALAVAIGSVVTLAAWAVTGFGGLAQYPQMLSNLSFIQEGRAVSLVAVLLAVGLTAGTASAVALAASLALLGFAWRIARRPDGDRKAFGLAIIAALTSTPIVWEHYMVLLFVPIALASPRLSPVWFLPPSAHLISGLFIAVSHASPLNTLGSAVLWIVFEALVIVRLCLTSSELAPRASQRLDARRALRPGYPVGATDVLVRADGRGVSTR